MIISIVAVVLALIVAGVLYATAPEPAPPVSVAPINTAPAPLPSGDVAMAAALPNAGKAAQGSGNRSGLGVAGARGGAGGSTAPGGVQGKTGIPTLQVGGPG